jgi:hypothetical protein
VPIRNRYEEAESIALERWFFDVDGVVPDGDGRDVRGKKQKKGS